MKWGAVIRDVAIIWILTALAGFVVGVTGAEGDGYAAGLAFANIIFGIVGFCISGCLVKYNRWKHLLIVAIGVWLVGLINIVIVPMTIFTWFLGVFLILAMMGIGGGLSYIFAKTPLTEEDNPQLPSTEEIPLHTEEA